MQYLSKEVRFMKKNSNVTFHQKPIQWLEPVQISANTLFRLSTKAETIKSVISTLEKLSPDDYLNFIIGYFKAGIERFSDSWGYIDLLTVLYAAAKILKPENYLEIGVRRGRSLGVVSSACPSVNIFGFDLWLSNYAGMENPGPDFVTNEITRLGHSGLINLTSGDSKKTVPKFIKDNPEVYFDLVTIDGDHSEEGAMIDLRNTLPKLKLGGVIVMDDIVHPQHKYLSDVWKNVIGRNKSFDSFMYSDIGYGVAWAVKRNE